MPQSCTFSLIVIARKRYIHYQLPTSFTIAAFSVRSITNFIFITTYHYLLTGSIIDHNRVLSRDSNIYQQHQHHLPIIPKRFHNPITMTAVHLTPKPTSNMNIMSACSPPPKAAGKSTQATTTMSHLTPKPMKHSYMLPMCPPPPKAALKPIDLIFFLNIKPPKLFWSRMILSYSPSLRQTKLE